MAEFLITFAAGASHGLTSVVVGQPLDTIKTRMQGMPQNATKTMTIVARDVFYREGIRGLYRGGVPLILGGSLMRSAQFGVSGWAGNMLKSSGLPSYKIGGVCDYQVILAGMAGGIGRAAIEIPTDFFKVRRQVETKYDLRSVLDGSVVTFGRNTLLFGSFLVYVDLSKQMSKAGYIPDLFLSEDRQGLSPFAKGAICANLAWLTCWPFDVVKTQRQSGNYVDRGGSSWELVKENMRSGRMFRGVVPGLVRSTISNGSSMVVYEKVHTTLSRRMGVDRKDMT